jgi:hypothetical protein
MEQFVLYLLLEQNVTGGHRGQQELSDGALCNGAFDARSNEHMHRSTHRCWR